MAQTVIHRVRVTNVDGSEAGHHDLWFTGKTEAEKQFRRINANRHPDYFEEHGAEALEPDLIVCESTKRGFVNFLNEHCAGEL